MTIKARIILFSGICLCLLEFQTSAGEPLKPASMTTNASASASGDSSLPALSADGRWVVFLSAARNLTTNGSASPFLNVYLRDLQAQATILVSHNGAGTGGGNGNSSSPTMSADGRWIVFESRASDLVANDTNGVSDIFLADLAQATTSLISSGLGGIGNGPSGNPTMTPDGRWVAFESAASNLVADDTNGIADIFLRDRENGVTLLVSVGAQNAAPGLVINPSKSGSPAITPDGRRIAFVSTATNLLDGVGTGNAEIYVRDIPGGQTLWASTNAFVLAGSNSYRCFSPTITTDGRYVAFKLAPSGGNGPSLVYHDLVTGLSTLVANNTTNPFNPPQLSADGRSLAYENGMDVFVWSADTLSNRLVSATLSGLPHSNVRSHTPVLSADGRLVVFLSEATDLVTNAAGPGFQIFARDLTTDETELISVNLSGQGADGDFETSWPAVSADGRQVAFDGLANDLVADDLNEVSDVFVRDLDAQTTQLVSQRAAESAAMTRALTSTAWPGSISGDGRYVAFTSTTAGQGLTYTNGARDVFIRDLQTGQTVQASHCAFRNSPFAPVEPSASQVLLSSNGQFVAYVCSGRQVYNPGYGQLDLHWGDVQNGIERVLNPSPLNPSLSPLPPNPPLQSMSADGRFVAFAVGNIMLGDMVANTNELISLRWAGDVAGNGQSIGPLISPDARWVLFLSLATDLLETNLPTATFHRLFARDRASNQTHLVSLDENGAVLGGLIRGVVLSGNMRFAAFHAARSAGSTNTSVFLHDLTAGAATNLLVCDNCANVSLSADGMLAAYETQPGYGMSKDIYTKDLRTGETKLISVGWGGAGGGNASSTSPLLTPDGRFVVFASLASNLVENDTNGASDIFVRDRLLGTTMLVSLNRAGTGPGNSASSKPVLGPDGRTVVFQSFASDLVAGDFNDRRDVFVLKLGGIDSDHDGMDDDWEMAYFGTLARDGTGDFDGDGLTDLQEFLAGTDPTNRGSVLRVMTLTSVNGGGTAILWSAVAGRTYRVQFKDNVEEGSWTDVPGDVVAVTTTGSKVDTIPAGAGRRFYRVLLVP